jgi:PTS system mannose-specific IIA component
MSMHVLLVTHEEIAEAFLSVARHTFGKQRLPIPVKTINIAPDASSDDIYTEVQEIIAELPDEQNILVLTDLFGSTPCNTILNLRTSQHIKVVTGLNMPMLLRVLNYASTSKSLSDLAEKAYDGGKNGVVQCDNLHHTKPKVRHVG